MEEVRERIKLVLQEKQTTVNSIAGKHGLNQSTLNNQVNGSTVITVNTILLILNDYPDISSEWLLRGNGNMFIQNNQPSEDSALIEALHARIAEQANYIADLRHIARLTDKR